MNCSLPSARNVSNTVHSEVSANPNHNGRNLSIVAMQWGQFLSHDLSLSSMSVGESLTLVNVCGWVTRSCQCLWVSYLISSMFVGESFDLVNVCRCVTTSVSRQCLSMSIFPSSLAVVSRENVTWILPGHCPIPVLVLRMGTINFTRLQSGQIYLIGVSWRVSSFISIN